MSNNETNSKAASRGETWLMRVLTLLLFVGIACRFIGLNWDGSAQQISFHLHPDERFLTDLVTRIRAPHTLQEFFHSQISPLNPLNLENVNLFVYGQLPLFIVKFFAVISGRDNYDNAVLTGRFVSALFDVGTILMLYLLARQAANRVLALMAATFYALCALAIQHAHFFVVDTFATFFITASFFFGARAAEKKSARWWLLCGAMWGAALACKISMILFTPVAGALLFLAWRRNTPARRILLCGAAMTLFALLSFRLGHPMAFQGEAGPLGGFFDVRLAIAGERASFWQSVAEQKIITDGGEVPFNFQWVSRDSLAFPLRNWLVWGTGPLLGLAGFAGVLFAASSVLMRVHKRPLTVSPVVVLAALWVLLVFGYHAVQFSKFTRYFLPITPLLCFCAAALLQKTQSELPVKWKLLPTILCLLPTVFWALAVTSIYTRPHTRVAASEWIRQNIAPETVVADESAWDDTLPLGANPGLEKINLSLEETDSLEKRRRLLDALQRADWIFISSQRQWSNIPRVTGRFPLTTEFYRNLFNEKLGFERTQTWTSFPQLLGVQFPDTRFEEALSVYDHPPVMLFRKTSEYSNERAAQILDSQLLRDVSSASLREIHHNHRVNENALPWPKLSTR